MPRSGKKSALPYQGASKETTRKSFHAIEATDADRRRRVVEGGLGKAKESTETRPTEDSPAGDPATLVAELAATPTTDRVRMRAILQRLLAIYPPEQAPPPPALPEKAPELWVERDLNRRENAPQFIRRVYAPWLGKGLARKDISRLDGDLYKALSVWLSRHKDDEIAQLLPSQSDRIDELIERLGNEYSIEDLRRLGYAIDSRLRRRTA